VSTSRPGWPTFRIGINTGRAVVGNVGAAGRHSFAAIGDTTNTAARLMAAGEPGQIVISGSTRGGLGDAFTVKEMGPTRVKGMREAVEAWLLTGEA
jgi:class 3 adenylate cyclase